MSILKPFDEKLHVPVQPGYHKMEILCKPFLLGFRLKLLLQSGIYMKYKWFNLNILRAVYKFK